MVDVKKVKGKIADDGWPLSLYLFLDFSCFAVKDMGWSFVDSCCYFQDILQMILGYLELESFCCVSFFLLCGTIFIYIVQRGPMHTAFFFKEQL